MRRGATRRGEWWKIRTGGRSGGGAGGGTAGARASFRRQSARWAEEGPRLEVRPAPPRQAGVMEAQQDVSQGGAEREPEEHGRLRRSGAGGELLSGRAAGVEGSGGLATHHPRRLD